MVVVRVAVALGWPAPAAVTTVVNVFVAIGPAVGVWVRVAVQIPKGAKAQGAGAVGESTDEAKDAVGSTAESDVFVSVNVELAHVALSLFFTVMV